MNGWLIALILTIIWLAIVYYLFKKGYVKKEGNISLFGPAIMLKTSRGKKWIEKVGKHKVWEIYGYLGLFLSLFLMFAVFAMLIWQAYLVTTIPPNNAPSPMEALGIPGINPIIPIWYGILGLIVAIVLHEFSHGFLVAYHKMKILSLGVLLFIVPIGAFVEPDEEELMKADRIKRMHVFAAGPTTNMILAILFLFMFSASMMAVTPVHPGVYVAGIGDINGHTLQLGDLITAVNGTEIESVNDFMNVNAPLPGKTVNITVYRNGFTTVHAVSGVVTMSVLKGYPAYKAGIKPGWIFYSINGTIIRNNADFYRVLNETRAGEKIKIAMLDLNMSMINVTVTLADKYSYYEKYSPSLNKEWYRGKGFLGVGAAYLGASVGDPNMLKTVIANPYHNANSPNAIFHGTMTLIALPFLHLMPFPTAYEHMFSVPFSGYWILVNSLYWIFWLNLMLGLTNLLPAVPLDGGYIFKDALNSLGERLKLKNVEKGADQISLFISLLILCLILWQFIGPRI